MMFKSFKEFIDYIRSVIDKVNADFDKHTKKEEGVTKNQQEILFSESENSDK